VVAAAVGGVATAAASYLRSHGKLSFTESAEDGLLGAAFVFGIYAVGHLLRSPWLEHKSEGPSGTLKDGIVGIAVIALLGFGTWTIAAYIADDVRSRITLLAPADPGQVKALEECKAALSGFTAPEPSNSLRRRTLKLADEFYRFVRQRQQKHPPYANSNDPNPTEETKKALALDRRYDQETQDQYNRLYRDRFIGIIREYQAKGVPVGWLENSARNGNIGWVAPGSSWEGTSLDQLTEFRDLAYRLNAQDSLIVLTY